MATAAEQQARLDLLERLKNWDGNNGEDLRSIQRILNSGTDKNYRSGTADAEYGRTSGGAICRFIADTPGALKYLEQSNPQLVSKLEETLDRRTNKPTIRQELEKTRSFENSIDTPEDRSNLIERLRDIQNRAQDTDAYKTSGNATIKADQELLTRVGLNPASNDDGLYGTTTQGAIDRIDGYIAKLENYITQDSSQTPSRPVPNAAQEPAVETTVDPDGNTVARTFAVPGTDTKLKPPTPLDDPLSTNTAPASIKNSFSSVAKDKGIALFKISNPTQDGDIQNAKDFARSAAEQFVERGGIAILHYPEDNDKITILGLEEKEKTLQGDEARAWLDENRTIANRNTRLVNFDVYPTANERFPGITAQRGYYENAKGRHSPTHGNVIPLYKNLQDSFSEEGGIPFHSDRRWKYITDNTNAPSIALHVSEKLDASQVTRAANALIEGTSQSRHFHGKLSESPLKSASQAFTPAASLPELGDHPIVILNASTSRGRHGHALTAAQSTAKELQKNGSIAILRDFKSGQYSLYYPGSSPKLLSALEGDSWYQNHIKNNGTLDPKRIVELDIIPTTNAKYRSGVEIREGHIDKTPNTPIPSKHKTLVPIDGTKDLREQLAAQFRSNNIKAISSIRNSRSLPRKYAVSEDTNHPRLRIAIHDQISRGKLDKIPTALADGIEAARNPDKTPESAPRQTGQTAKEGAEYARKAREDLKLGEEIYRRELFDGIDPINRHQKNLRDRFCAVYTRKVDGPCDTLKYGHGDDYWKNKFGDSDAPRTPDGP